MLQVDDNLNTTPTNGGSTDNQGLQSPRNQDAKKGVSGRELYEKKFGFPDASPAQEAATSKAPSALRAYLKRRLDGALRRIETAEGKIRDYTRIVSSRRALGLTSAEVKAYRCKKLEVEVELRDAKSSRDLFQKQYNEALEEGARPYRERLKASREEAFLTRVAPSKANSVIEMLTVAGGNGHAGEVENLRRMLNGPRAEFKLAFMALVKELDPSIHEEFVKRPKLQTRVMNRVIDYHRSKA